MLQAVYFTFFFSICLINFWPIVEGSFMREQRQGFNMWICFAVLLTINTVTRAETPPNIVLIIGDDLGWNDIGWNNPGMITPNLNKLARKGVILDNLYVQPMCSPTRAAILTGYYPYHMGLQHKTVEETSPKYIPEDIPLLSNKLKELNYATHLVGKWHLGNCNIKYTPTRRGFDSFLGYYTATIDYYNRTVATVRNPDAFGKYDFRRGTEVYYPPIEYTTKMFARRAVDIISRHDHSRPLFLQLAFTSPHRPLEVPKKFETLYKCVTDPNRRIFNGMVTTMDLAVGKVVQALEKHNLMENTLIFFMADNGGEVENSGNNVPYRGAKQTLWEGGTKSTSFVYSRTLLKKTGYRNTKMIHAVDVFPTLLSLAGGTPDGKIDGKNQWQALSENAKSARNEFVYNIDELDKNAAIRDGDLKLIEGMPSTIGYNGIYALPADNCRNSHGHHWRNKFIKHQESYRHDHEEKVESYQYQTGPTSKDCNRMFSKRIYRLYNLTRDPQERFNIACHLPDKLESLIDRLEYYKKSLVTAQEISYTGDFGVPYINDVISHQWC